MARHSFGSAPGPTGAPVSHARFAVSGCLDKIVISGGAIDVSGAADGSDTLKSVFSSTYPTEDLLGGDTVTWATDDATFARLICAKINEKSTGHHYWATRAADHVFVWPKDGTVSDTGVISVDDTSFTASVANMNVEQAFVAGVPLISGGYGADNVAATMLQLKPNFSRLPDPAIGVGDVDDDGVSAYDMRRAKGIELDILLEDADLTAYMGWEGGYAQYVATEKKRRYDILAASPAADGGAGSMGFFVQTTAQIIHFGVRGY